MTGATLQKTTKSETAAIGRASQRTEEEPSPRRWLILGVLAAVAFMAQLDLFVVNIALPAMAGSFGHAKLSGLSWVLNGYSITFAALLVPMGRLADHFGRKRFLLAGVGVFTLGSVIDAVAPSLVVMVIGRVIQAVGGAMIIPTSLGLLYPSFPKHEHAKVVGIWAGVAAIAASSGPTIGGLLVHVDWRWIFVINVPIGAATVIAGVKILPEVRAHKSARLPDAFSGLVLVATLALVTFATVQSSTWGWGDPRTIAAFAIAVITGAATVWRTITHPHALIEASLFESRQFTTATAALFLFFVAFAGWLLMNVLLFQEQWHWGVIKTGLLIIPGPLSSAVFAINAGRITGKFGRTLPAIVGPLLFAAASGFWLIAAHDDPNYWTGWFPGLIVAGSGVGMTQAPLFAAANTLAPERAGTGSAILNMSRQVGSAIGVAVVVTLLASAPGLVGYQHVLVFMIVALVLASATSILGARGKSATVASPAAAGGRP